MRGVPLLALLAFTAIILVSDVLGHSHSHSHSHSDEPAHLKYSREVNEAALREEEEDHYGHSHSGGHHHSHHHDEEEHHHHDEEEHHHHDEEEHHHHDEEEHHHHHHGGHDHQHSHGHSHGHEDSHAKEAPKSSNGKEYVFDKNGLFASLNDRRIRLWVYSIGSTLLISAFPCFILAFIPIQANTGENSPLLKLLLAFGAGGLLGDAFLHLIPHATPAGGHSHSHSHSHAAGHSHEPHDMSVGGWVLIGFMAFFIVEKFVRIIRGEEGHSHGHSHSAPSKAKHSSAESDDGQSSEEKAKLLNKGRKEAVEKKAEALPEVVKIRVAAYLNLVADFMHNFTDGLAIGASFIAGSTIGLVTMITVLVHEIPHEIGDFAILVQSGYSKRKAMLIQLCTALGALGGCIVSLWSVDAYALAEAAEQSWVLPFTAGGFIYIATVSVIPELLEGSTFWQSVREVFAILLGVFMMYLIALYE